jgi:signal transduction histidine kinase
MKRLARLHLPWLANWLANWRANLRARIVAGMLLLVGVTALVVTLLANYAGERLEENINFDLLAEELSHYQHRLQADPGAAPLRSALLRIYRSSDIKELPREIARLEPGVHHAIRNNGRSFRILIQDSDFGRLYITYDVTDHEKSRRWALLILMTGVVAVLAITTWAAFRLSKQLVGPVLQLADKLSNVDPRERNVRVAPGFVGSELEPIARSIDSFLERLDGFVEREQAFTATASHELRTPLAVIQGAVELLEEQYPDQPLSQNALARIQRAVREMADFTAALLSLAREPDARDRPTSECNMTTLLPRVVEDQCALVPNKAVRIDLDESNPLYVNAPDSMVAMVIGNIVRNALQHGNDNEVHCRLQARTLTVENSGGVDSTASQRLFQRNFSTRPGGTGMGLYLARRICDRYGWQLNLTSDVNHTRVSVSL